MSDIDNIERRASKLLIAMGGGLLIALMLLAFNNFVLRGTETGPIFEIYKESNVDASSTQTVPPSLQKRFYK